MKYERKSRIVIILVETHLLCSNVDVDLFAGKYLETSLPIDFLRPVLLRMRFEQTRCIKRLFASNVDNRKTSEEDG